MPVVRRISGGLAAGLAGLLLVAVGDGQEPAPSQPPPVSGEPDPADPASGEPTAEQRQAAARSAEAARAALEQGELETARNQMQQAVQLHPRHPLYQYQLGAILHTANDHRGAWPHFQQAAALAPDNETIAKAFQAYWRNLEEQGAFRVGQSREVVLNNFGKPAHELADRRTGADRLVYGYYALDFRQDELHEVNDLRGLQPEHLQPQEIVVVDLDGRDWRTRERRNSRRGAVAQLRLAGDDRPLPEEVVVIERLHRAAAEVPSLRELVLAEADRVQPAGADEDREILAEPPGSIVIYRRVSGRGGDPPRHELVRLWKAERDVHRLAYWNHSAEFDASAKKRWTEILLGAQLKKVDLAAAPGEDAPPSKAPGP